MPTSRLGRIAMFAVFGSLLAICLAVNAYLTHRVAYPPRTLRIRIVLDPANPSLQGAPPDALKALVESVSGFFENSAGIRLSVTGFADVKIGNSRQDPEVLRRFIEVRTPRDGADILVAFWTSLPSDPRLGAALPYTPVAIARFDPTSPERNRAVLVHQLLTLFGVPVSKDAKSVMNPNPSGLNLASDSKAYLMDSRLFDFSQGLAGMNRRMQSRVLDSLRRQGDDAPPRLRLADLLMRDASFDAATAQYRVVTSSNPANLPAHFGLARALAMTSQYPAAETEARNAVKLAPNSDDSHYALGYVLVRSGNPEAAIEEFRRSIGLNPNSARNHAGLAVAYSAAIGEFDQAASEFETARKLEPNNPMLLADMDYVQRLQIRIEREAVAAQAAVEARPRSGPLHNRLAVILLRQGKIQQGLEQARQALKLGPESWQMHYTVAVALYASHDLAASQAELEIAKKLGSGSRPHLEESLRSAFQRGPSSIK